MESGKPIPFRLQKKEKGGVVMHVCLSSCDSPHQVGIPQSDNTSHGKLSHEEIIHPPEGKLDVLNGVAAQVYIQ